VGINVLNKVSLGQLPAVDEKQRRVKQINFEHDRTYVM
jgi:hypothetical protein